MCNRVSSSASGSARRSGACSLQAVAALVHRQCVRKLASAPGVTAPPAGSNELRPAGADTRHRHCDTPARCAGRPKGQALRPKARSRPSTPNLDLASEREVEIDYTDGTNNTLQKYHTETVQGSSFIQN